MAKTSRRLVSAISALKNRLENRSAVVAQMDATTCEAAAIQYNAAVLAAAQKLLELEDAQAAYDNSLLAAMAALIVMQQECSV